MIQSNEGRCRVTDEKLEVVCDFNKQPLGNGFLEKQEFNNEYYYNMKIGFCNKSKMLQLVDQPSPEAMFHGNYAFFSSTSNYMQKHFEKFAKDVLSSKYFKSSSFVIELGCNDGILLKHFSKSGIKHLGIEPSENVAKLANESGIDTISEFFDEKLADEIINKYGHADIFMAANVMCHIPDIRSVVRGIKKLLSQQGVAIFEDPYLGDVVTKTSYDQIYDEHVFLFSALSIEYLFGLEGMDLINLEPQITHGGSMRYTIAHKGAYVREPIVDEILGLEIKQGLDRAETFKHFGQRVHESAVKLKEMILDLKSKGKKIAGYAATSKSTTVLNYCGIDGSLLEYIADSTPLKQGKFSPGMHIPIKSIQYFNENPPDYALLLAWNHQAEILDKEREFSVNGGRWITHVPYVRVIND